MKQTSTNILLIIGTILSGVFVTIVNVSTIIPLSDDNSLFYNLAWFAFVLFLTAFHLTFYFITTKRILKQANNKRTSTKGFLAANSFITLFLGMIFLTETNEPSELITVSINLLIILTVYVLCQISTYKKTL